MDRWYLANWPGSAKLRIVPGRRVVERLEMREDCCAWQGLTYVGLADVSGGTEVRRFTWTGDRGSNRDESAAAALAWLIERAEAAP